MRETSLVYIVKEDSCLMLHRIRKEKDINHGKWIGVGGKFEPGESPEECMRREVREETGLYIDKYRYCGIVTFQSDDDETEYMHLFLATDFHGSLKSCDEGVLEWLPVSELTKIPHWVGDRIFLSLIMYGSFPFFSLKLVYRDGLLTGAVLNEHNCLVTERLILRPWLEEDAAALYRWASNPKIGLSAGWAPHKSEEESREVIKEVLNRPECYAIVRRDSGEPVGCAGLTNFRLADEDGSLISYFDERKSVHPTCCSMPDLPEPEEKKENSGRTREGAENARAGLPDGVRVEAELGYWLAEPFWGRGYAAEASKALLDHGFHALGLERIWCSYYDGNERSRRTQERLGFHYHHTDENVYLPLLKERRTSICNVMTASGFKSSR